jgi:hypothetical protein
LFYEYNVLNKKFKYKQTFSSINFGRLFVPIQWTSSNLAWFSLLILLIFYNWYNTILFKRRNQS